MKGAVHVFSPLAVCFPSRWRAVCNERVDVVYTRRLTKYHVWKIGSRTAKLFNIFRLRCSSLSSSLIFSASLMSGISTLTDFDHLWISSSIAFFFCLNFCTCCSFYILFFYVNFWLCLFAGIRSTMTELYEVLPCARNRRSSPFSGSAWANNLVGVLSAGFK